MMKVIEQHLFTTYISPWSALLPSKSDPLRVLTCHQGSPDKYGRNANKGVLDVGSSVMFVSFPELHCIGDGLAIQSDCCENIAFG